MFLSPEYNNINVYMEKQESISTALLTTSTKFSVLLSSNSLTTLIGTICSSSTSWMLA